MGLQTISSIRRSGQLGEMAPTAQRSQRNGLVGLAAVLLLVATVASCSSSGGRDNGGMIPSNCVAEPWTGLYRGTGTYDGRKDCNDSFRNCQNVEVELFVSAGCTTLNADLDIDTINGGPGWECREGLDDYSRQYNGVQPNSEFGLTLTTNEIEPGNICTWRQVSIDLIRNGNQITGSGSAVFLNSGFNANTFTFTIQR